MNGTGCDRVREAIPELVAGGLGSDERADVAAHLETCADCQAEAELISLLAASRPEPPTGLSLRIQRSVGRRRPMVRHPWWGLAAAAVAAVALGIGVTSRQGGTDAEVPAYVAGTQTEDLWLTDDGLLAGAPALDGLSDDALEQLLEEITSGGQA